MLHRETIMRKLVVRGAFVTAFVLSGITGWTLFGAATTPAAAALDNCKDCIFGMTGAGVKLNTRGVKKAERLGLGHYQVTFKKTIEGCAILANAVNLPGEGPIDAYISAELTNDPKVVDFTAFTAEPDGHQAVDVTFSGALICI
jgi:hypothetical protein